MIIPRHWFVVFKKKSKLGWANWVPSKFKHCFCLAFIEEMQSWVVVEFAAQSGSMVAFVADSEASDILTAACDDAVVLKVVSRATKGWGWGLWCVPLTAQLIGIPSCALRVDGLFRDCMRNGGEIIANGAIIWPMR